MVIESVKTDMSKSKVAEVIGDKLEALGVRHEKEEGQLETTFISDNIDATVATIGKSTRVSINGEKEAVEAIEKEVEEAKERLKDLEGLRRSPDQRPSKQNIGKYKDTIRDTTKSPKGDIDRRQYSEGREHGKESVVTHDDGSITFKPRFEKGEVDYVNESEKHNNKNSPECRSCTHYIEGGGCHLVQGNIDPKGHCELLFSDFGAFGVSLNGKVDSNLQLLGEGFNWTEEESMKFLKELADFFEEELEDEDYTE